MLVAFEAGMAVLQRLGSLEAPDWRLTDMFVPMFHPADAMVPEGFWERSEVPLKHIQLGLDKGWESMLPTGRSLRPDASEESPEVRPVVVTLELPNLSKMKKAALVDFAAKNGLNLGAARTKSEIIGAIEAAVA
jgi:hypothetical protein